LATGCRRVPTPAGTDALDPAWAPSRQELAFVEGRQSSSPSFTKPVVRTWSAGHTLAIYHAKSGTTRAIPHSGGAATPLRSRNGRAILYVADNRLELARLGGRQPHRVAKPVVRTSLALLLRRNRLGWSVCVV
jgi:dipeptidyl aminopeptidase/acylaminoacyl peptidase